MGENPWWLLREHSEHVAARSLGMVDTQSVPKKSPMREEKIISGLDLGGGLRRFREFGRARCLFRLQAENAD